MTQSACTLGIIHHTFMQEELRTSETYVLNSLAFLRVPTTQSICIMPLRRYLAYPTEPIIHYTVGEWMHMGKIYERPITPKEKKQRNVTEKNVTITPKAIESKNKTCGRSQHRTPYRTT